jgi:outer membrane protein OmpA-like peptidoglycan-associated protein
MADIGDIGERSLQDFGVEMDLNLVFAGHILRGIHAAQKRQAYCLTTTKTKHDSAMFQRKYAAFISLAAATALFTLSCSDYTQGRYDAASPDEKSPARDQFVGSIYFSTSSSALSKAALADLGRMANRIQERRGSTERVILIGYADRNRGVEENSEIAGERAQRVAIAFEKRGIELERIVIDGRGVRLTKRKEAERRVDIYLENSRGPGQRLNTLYPVLIGFFLLVTFALAVVIFRRRR